MTRDQQEPGVWGVLYALVGLVMALLAAACAYGIANALGTLL